MPRHARIDPLKAEASKALQKAAKEEPDTRGEWARLALSWHYAIERVIAERTGGYVAVRTAR